MQINETVSVSTNASGAPVAFVWRSVSYAVIAEPELWFEKIAWWHSLSAPTRTQVAPERTLFRVNALPYSGPRSLHSTAPDDGIYDLTVSPDKEWVLVRAHTEIIDAQLFA